MPLFHTSTFSLIFPLLFLFFVLFTSSPYSAAARSHRADASTPSDLVRSSCVHASYPSICIRTLSSYSGPAVTPRDLAQASVKVSLARASRVSKYLNRLSTSQQGGSKRQRAALRDCVEQISDSVDELSRTLSELKHLRGETFRWQMSNAETWVSAAMTNEDTCLDGFQDVDGKRKSDVRRKITNVARVTSNALYMINRLDESRGRSGSIP
ncbi:pectinesterase inhibitor 3 [Ziziphus jujuba]|uniref:Pectinesterase inhibitor 3 n=1 Tax=Ziziphus jujuba TaxID=326968 RepID=A0A6P3Z0C8_ZIZJJ|nr:pectinesterase inhibitor 3 [Ziziphus jujuba]